MNIPNTQRLSLGNQTGDVNRDGTINSLDLQLLEQAVAQASQQGNLGELPANENQNADINRDGRITEEDVADLAQGLKQTSNKNMLGGLVAANTVNNFAVTAFLNALSGAS